MHMSSWAFLYYLKFLVNIKTWSQKGEKEIQMNIRKREMQASLIIMISAIIIKNITESNIS